MNINEFLSQLRENQCKKIFDENGFSSNESSLMNFYVTLMTNLKYLNANLTDFSSFYLNENSCEFQNKILIKLKKIFHVKSFRVFHQLSRFLKIFSRIFQGKTN
jgi:hypothetical protein